MKTLFKFMLLTGALALFLGSPWVSYSRERICPTMQGPKRPMGEGEFLAAHGLTQGNFSIWLKEHSVWRRKYDKELKSYSFIPQDYDTHRR